MGIFSKDKKKKDLTLIFDIGSSSVGGALCYIENSGTPKIIYSIREPISIQNEVSFDTLLSSIMKSLDIVANKICTMGFGKPDKIFCFLSSLLYGSQTRTIKLEKNNSFIFTLKIADSLIKKEISLFEEERLIKHIHSNEQIRPIELKNMKTMLNGYAVDKPLDKKIKEIEMNVFISMSSDEILKKIEYTIGKYFNPKDIKFSSFLMAFFTVIRDMFAYHESFLLVDIDGEITDISIIKNDVLCESISFPNGLNFITRGVANFLNLSLDEAKSLISLYKDDYMEEQIKKKFDPVINKLKEEWLKKFQESLFNISNNISIPLNIFLISDKDFLDFFTKIIKTEEFNQYALTQSKFKITSLNTKELHGIATFKENIYRDPFLTIESIYINRLSDKI
ncbi:MAG: hypothetical protein WC264_01190 [Candidatus Paceibacterota bacterium]|jgi:cell division ATPase FtsA